MIILYIYIVDNIIQPFAKKLKHVYVNKIEHNNNNNKMNFNMMFDYTAIGNAMKMTGRTYDQLTEDEKEEYVRTMEVMEGVDVPMPMSMPMSMSMPWPMHIQMPMPWYIPPNMFHDNTANVEARADAVDEQMSDIKSSIANNLAQHIDDVSEIKEEIQLIKTEFTDSIQTLTEISDNYELNNNKNHKKQHLINYSIWVWLVITSFANFNVVINSQTNNIIYSVLILLQIYIITIITTK